MLSPQAYPSVLCSCTSHGNTSWQPSISLDPSKNYYNNSTAVHTSEPNHAHQMLSRSEEGAASSHSRRCPNVMIVAC